jgi:ABC-type Fe3+ transport system permease subunit
MSKNSYFRLAKIFGLAAILSFLVYVIVLAVWFSLFWDDLHSHLVQTSISDAPTIAVVTLAFSGITSVLATLGTASTILLGWRSDRRQAKESKLKMEQLELQLADARKASAAAQLNQASQDTQDSKLRTYS